jgi:aminoglycoside 6'-N-acetyltransferase
VSEEQILHGERVTLRPLVEADLLRIVEIIGHPEVRPWWQYHDEVRLHRELFEDPEVTSFAVELDSEVVGVIEYYEQTDPDYKHAGIDIALDPVCCVGQGLGPDALKTLIRYLFAERGQHRIIIDPAVANERAIAAYQKVGFKPVGVMRQYERDSAGEWHDNLLLDLLRDEFESQEALRCESW